MKATTLISDVELPRWRGSKRLIKGLIHRCDKRARREYIYTRRAFIYIVFIIIHFFFLLHFAFGNKKVRCDIGGKREAKRPRSSCNNERARAGSSAACDTLHHGDEIQSRVALHKRRHIPFLLRAFPDFGTELRISTRASRPNLIAAEIYTSGAAGGGATGLSRKAEWKRQREWLHFADFSRLSLTS